MIAAGTTTPRPWVAERNSYGLTIRYPNEYGSTPICELWDNGDDKSANADLIIEAVNSFEALTAERDALKAENAKLRQATDELLEVIRPFAVRGMHTSPVQHVTLGSCQRARAAYDRRLRSDFLVLPVTP